MSSVDLVPNVIMIPASPEFARVSAVRRQLRVAAYCRVSTDQHPKYLLPDHHEGIVDRQTFDAVQTKMAQRSADRSSSRKNAPTGWTSYASKYALSERLVCGECGSHTPPAWAKRGKKRTV